MSEEGAIWAVMELYGSVNGRCPTIIICSVLVYMTLYMQILCKEFNASTTHNLNSCQLPHPRRKHGEVEEDATVLLFQREGAKLRDGLQRSEGFVDGYDDRLIHLLQLRLDVVGITVT
jgi:hypothetical protein